MSPEIFGRELVPWRPVRELDRVFDEVEKTFEDIFGRPFFPVPWRRVPAVRAWSPPIEMYEKKDEYVVKAELPGMKKEEIEISLLGDTLSIKGERKSEEDVKNESYYLCERCYGSFERSVTYPAKVDAKKSRRNMQMVSCRSSCPRLQKRNQRNWKSRQNKCTNVIT